MLWTEQNWQQIYHTWNVEGGRASGPNALETMAIEAHRAGQAHERSMAGWQPIETAPKDGSEFQAWGAEHGRGWWEPRARVNPESAALETWGRVDYDWEDWEAEHRLTHWQPQPLPPPPTE
jgi:hypothetical protein